MFEFEHRGLCPWGCWGCKTETHPLDRSITEAYKLFRFFFFFCRARALLIADLRFSPEKPSLRFCRDSRENAFELVFELSRKLWLSTVFMRKKGKEKAFAGPRSSEEKSGMNLLIRWHCNEAFGKKEVTTRAHEAPSSVVPAVRSFTRSPRCWRFVNVAYITYFDFHVVRTWESSKIQGNGDFFACRWTFGILAFESETDLGSEIADIRSPETCFGRLCQLCQVSALCRHGHHLTLLTWQLFLPFSCFAALRFLCFAIETGIWYFRRSNIYSKSCNLLQFVRCKFLCPTFLQLFLFMIVQNCLFTYRRISDSKIILIRSNILRN